MKTTIGLVLAALTLVASPALASDPFVDGYDSAENVCARNVSCCLIISAPLDGAKAYDVEFEARAAGPKGRRPHTRKTLCKTTAAIDPGR